MKPRFQTIIFHVTDMEALLLKKLAGRFRNAETPDQRADLAARVALIVAEVGEGDDQNTKK